jgi:hypothetical protein
MIRVPGVQKTTPNMVSLQAPQVQQFEQTEGIQMLGQAASTAARAGSKLVEIGNKGMRNARVSKAKEGQVRAAQEIRRLLQDRDSGYLTKQGGAARDGISDFERELAEVNKKLRASFDDDETREMFEQATAVDFTRAQAAAGLHWAKQSQVANAAQSKVRYGQLSDDVAAGDWGARVDLRDEINEYGRVVGMSEEQRQELYKDTLSTAQFTYAETLLDLGDLDKAEEELDKEGRGTHIEEASRAKLVNRLRREQKAQAAMGKVEKTNEKAQKLAMDTLGRYEMGPQLDGYGTAQMHADARQELKDKLDAGDIDAATYQRANTLVDAEVQDRKASEDAAVAQAADPLTEELRKDPRLGIADLQERNPDAVRRLMSTRAGQLTLRRMLTKSGKEDADNTYRNIALAYDTKNLELLRVRIPDPAALTKITAGMSEEKAKFVRRAYTDAHGITFKEGDRVSLESIVRQKLKGYAWALDRSDPDKPVVDLRMVDTALGVINARGQTHDEKIEALDKLFSDTIWSYGDGDHPVPRELAAVMDPTVASQVRGDTRYGRLQMTDISMDVREHMEQVAKTLYFPDREVDPKSISRRAEELWLRYDRPTTLAEAQKLTENMNPLAANVDPSVGADFDYVAQQVHPDSLRIYEELKATPARPAAYAWDQRGQDAVYRGYAIAQHGDPEAPDISAQEAETRRFAVDSAIERMRYDVVALKSAKPVEVATGGDIEDYDAWTSTSNEAQGADFSAANKRSGN